jgi:hypothetical protein
MEVLFMAFSDDLKELANRVCDLSKTITNEEATKMSMVVPFFQLLGYDVFNSLEFYPEYTADVGVKKGEKVDYAIIINGAPEILIECKSCNELLDKHSSQLFRYFGTTTAKFGILTNGLCYKFYTDLDETNKMDMEPFLEMNLADLKDAHINEVKKFCKEVFDKDSIFSTASELKYSTLIKDWLKSENENVSDEFAKTVLSFVYDGPRTQKVIEKFKPIIKKSFNGYINDIVNQKISSALSPDEVEESDTDTTEDTSKTSRIITTEEELQSFYIIRGLLAEVVDINDVVYRDTESYFGILYKDNNRKPICRLNLDTKKKQLLIPDEQKTFTRYYIDTINDICKYKEQLIASVQQYL